jgi:DNA repair protein RadC
MPDFRQIDIFTDFATGGSFRAVAADLTEAEKKTIQEAFAILERTLRRSGVELTAPGSVADYLKLNSSSREHEVFTVLFLDNKNCLIEKQDMFRGTINAASVYPREVVKEALRLNAAAVILAHNHPSGVEEPSQADRAITKRVKDALELVGVQTLDHFIIARTNHLSFAEKGLMP